MYVGTWVSAWVGGWGVGGGEYVSAIQCRICDIGWLMLAEIIHFMATWQRMEKGYSIGSWALSTLCTFCSGRGIANKRAIWTGREPERTQRSFSKPRFAPSFERQKQHESMNTLFFQRSIQLLILFVPGVWRGMTWHPKRSLLSVVQEWSVQRGHRCPWCRLYMEPAIGLHETPCLEVDNLISFSSTFMTCFTMPGTVRCSFHPAVGIRFNCLNALQMVHPMITFENEVCDSQPYNLTWIFVDLTLPAFL